MKYSLRSLMIVGILALAPVIWLLTFLGPGSPGPDFDPDVKVVGGSLKIDDKFNGSPWKCECRMSADDVSQLMKRLSPGKPYSGTLGSTDDEVMARVDVDTEEGRVIPLVIYWTGQNPADFRWDGTLYRHDVKNRDFYDEGLHIHGDLKDLCKSRQMASQPRNGLPINKAPATTQSKP
jgi:hypothetical protein